jgi:hypothetical protein
MRETATARITLDENGLIIVRVHADARQRPSDAQENLDAALAEGSGLRRPILVDITDSPPLDAETRHVYSGQLLVAAFTALALVVEASPLGVMMGNVYIRVARPGIPTHLFTDAALARRWLARHMA